MDKRSLIFVVALTLSLFMVNMAFQWMNQDNLKQWEEKQLEKKVQKATVLDLSIKERTAQPQELPMVILYADKEEKQPLQPAILTSGTLLTVQLTATPSPHAFYQGQEYELAYRPTNEGEPLLYKEKGGENKLTLGNLPDFGKYDLQLLLIDTPSESRSLLAEYVDGIFSIPQFSLDKLKKELDEQAPAPKMPATQGIVLLKNGKEYLPVGIYQPERGDVSYLEDLEAIAPFLDKPKADHATSTAEAKQEKFYVLENGYQQLVFSNIGGALAEINLPFLSKIDQESVVKEIEFDRQMVEKHPYNAHFPAHGYYTPEKSAEGSYAYHQTGKLGGYYPLLRRDLIETGNRNSVSINPRYYALNLLSEYPEMSELVYEVKHFDSTKIIFEATQRNRKITKTFSIVEETNGAPYCLDVVVQIEGDSRGLWINSGVPEVEWISGAPAPALMYRITRNQKSGVEAIDLPSESFTVSSLYPDWICNSNGFFGLILDPLTEIDPGYRVQMIPGTTVPSRLVEIDQEYNKHQAQSLPGYMVMLPLKNGGGEMHFRAFAGPFSTDILKAVDNTYKNADTGITPDYLACQTFHGWFAFISEPFANFLFLLMEFFHYLTGSWAFSIILLTVALRVMLYPLNAWSTKSMLKMQQIAPQTAAIQEKYKKDPKKAQQEIMGLYRDAGVNPLSGCFPLLIQMPFLIGMFDLLKSTFELRGASFIPGWIDNLTAPDVLFSWSRPLFFIGNEFHLLPILLGLVMFAQQKLMSTLPADPALLTEQQRQQKSMGSIMAAVFAFMFYSFPSGLNIYWLSSMLLGMLQQWWTQKKMRAKTN